MSSGKLGGKKKIANKLIKNVAHSPFSVFDGTSIMGKGVIQVWDLIEIRDGNEFFLFSKEIQMINSIVYDLYREQESERIKCRWMTRMF